MSNGLRSPFLWLGLVALALTLGTAGWGDLYNETDGQYSGAARVMAEGGSWLVPENNGVPRLVKPPLLYWMMAGAMCVAGVSEFAARMPNALAVTAWVLLTAWIVSRAVGRRVGILAGLVLLTAMGTFTLGRIIMPEPLFSAFILGALVCVVEATSRPATARWWAVGFWASAALACLTKGPHGLLYPLAAAGIAAWIVPALRPAFRALFHWSGALVFALLVLPWYVALELRFPGFLRETFVVEMLGHVKGSEAPATSYTNVPRWQFLLLHAAWFLPWTLVVLPSLVRRWKWREPGPGGAVLLGLAAVVGISVLLAGQRQDYYAMAMWPTVAAGMAWVLGNGRPRAGFLLAAGVLLAAGLVALVVPLGVPVETGGVAERSTAWRTLGGFGPEVWSDLRAGGLVVLFTAGLLFVGAAAMRGRWSFACAVAAAAVLDLGAVWGTARVAPYFSLAAVVPEIERSAPEDVTVVFEGGADTASSLYFYGDRRVYLLGDVPRGWEAVAVNDDGLRKSWTAGRAVALVTEESRLGHWTAVLGGPLVPAARSGTQVLIRNY